MVGASLAAKVAEAAADAYSDADAAVDGNTAICMRQPLTRCHRSREWKESEKGCPNHTFITARLNPRKERGKWSNMEGNQGKSSERGEEE